MPTRFYCSCLICLLLCGCHRDRVEDLETRIATLQERLEEREQEIEVLQDREIDIVLPADSEAVPLVTEPAEVLVHVDKDGHYIVDGDSMTLEALTAKLTAAAAADSPPVSVVIRTEKSVPVQHVIDVMSLCNQLGISEYVLTTVPEE